MNGTYFISYSKYDVKWAVWIEYVLREIVGGKTKMQEYDFHPGDNFKAHMDNALKEGYVVICVLTRAYMESENCREEWSNAERFIPVKCDDCEPKGLLKSRIYINLYGLNKKEARKALVEGLREKTRPDDEPEYPFEPGKTMPDEPDFPSFAGNNLPDRYQFFTGREDILDKIAIVLKEASTVIITGQGGFGKTQTAVEYAYLHGKEYKCIWYFNAESEMRLQDDYREFAMRVVGLKTARTEEFAVVRSLMDRWLSENNLYLFIYDNAESCPDLKRYLPHGRTRGHIIINTRERLQGITGEKLDATVFSPADAAAFLEKRIEGGNKAEAEELSKALGCLPLALEQAAAYINENQHTIAEYLDLLRDSGLRVFETTSPDTDYNKTILTTWKISFDKIEQDEQSKASVQLLKLLAYCAPDDIPLQMFIDGRDQLPQLLQDALSPDDIPRQNELIGKLTRYSFITWRRDEQRKALLSIHRLIQEVVDHDSGGATEHLRYCLNMADAIFNYEYGVREDFDSSARNLPHMLYIACHAESKLGDNKEAMIKTACIYDKAGIGLANQGNFAEALEWVKKALIIREKVLGTEHPDTASTYSNIAGIFQDQGNFAAALMWFKKAMTIREKVLGRHPDTASTYSNTASVFRYQGDYAGALLWFKKALDIFKKVLGDEHPSTAATYNNIAGVYRDQGDYAAALEWYFKALDIREKVLGTEHPDTAATYNNIALSYKYQGDFAVALRWLMKALIIHEKVLGTEHPSTAATYNNIAGVFQDQGNFAAALEWYKKDLTISEKVLGAEHPDTATTYNNLAGVYRDQGEYAAALEWYRKSYRIFFSKLGETNPKTKTVKANMEDAYSKAGLDESFEQWLQRVVN